MEIAFRPRGNSTQRDWRSHSSSITPSVDDCVLPFLDMSTERPGLDIGIALFRRIEEEYSYTHWALISLERPHTYNNAPVHLYQINNYDASGARIPWYTDFYRDVMLSLDPTIIGVVHLGTVDMPQDHLDQYITEMGAGQSTTHNTRGLGWSNTSFIIRIVETLSEAGLLEIPSTIGQFRFNIQETGTRLELMRDWGGDTLPILNA